MKSRRLLAAACLLVVTACNDKPPPATTQTPKADNAISWYEGYTLPTLLAQPFSLREPADLTSIGAQKWYAEFALQAEGDPKKTLTVSSCNDYLPHASERWHTANERDNAAFMEIAVMCRATQLMQAATKAKQSYLNDLAFNADLPKRLPATIALVVSPTERARLNADRSRKRWADVTPMTQVETLSPFRANYRHASGAQELALVAKSDFNGDAIEDVLITSRDSVDNGSYDAVRLFLVTRTSATGDVTVLNEYLR